MLDLGIVKPGATLRIPFSSFDKDDGSSVTMTNFAAADVLIYKDGSTTDRGESSTAGVTATTDFDAKTGKHLAIIALADNTVAGYYAAGSEYLIGIDAVTIDGVTTGGWIARFSIGYAQAALNTTIATLASQTSFTLAAGPAEDDALDDMWAVIHDVASSVQASVVQISDYTGATRTVTLLTGATFTAAATDNISIMGPMCLQPTVVNRKLDVSSGGEAGLDWANVGTPGSTVGLSATTISVATTLTNAPSDSSGVTTLLSRLGGITGSGVNTVLGFFKALLSKTATVPTDIGGTFDPATDSTEAVRDKQTDIEADTADLQTRLPTALVSGRMDSDTQAMANAVLTSAKFAAGAIDAAAIAANALGAAELATDAVNEIRDAVFARAFAAAYGSHTFEELVAMMSVALFAKCSGMATVTGVFRNLADTADVITATIDADGNRTAVTRTP